MEYLVSDTSAHEALIYATVEAKLSFGGRATHLETGPPTSPSHSLPDGLHASSSLHSRSHLVHGHCARHPTRAIKITEPTPNLAFRYDVLFDCVISLQKHALVGKWHFADMEDSDMHAWLHSKWHILLDYIPTIVRLLNGWYNFHFLCQEDLEKIKSVPWLKGSSFLTLYFLYIGFNPLR